MISRDTFSRPARVALWLVLQSAVVIACAVSVPPSGGPEDRVAPTVVGTVPTAGSTSVDPETVVQIAFSEPLLRDGFNRHVVFSPPVEIARIRWKGSTASIKLLEPLHPDTTYVVSLAAGYRDERNVAAKNSFQFAFATAAHLDTGQVSGVVHFRREPTKKAIVRGFVLPTDSGFSPDAALASRETRTNKLGEYTLRYLAPTEDGLIIWGFEDDNGNGKFDPASEYGAVYPDTVVLTAQVSIVSGRDIFIIDPTEPAIVRGMVTNETGVDTMLVSVGLFASGDTLTPSYLTRCDTVGAFVFGAVRRGVYSVSAFIDLQPDSMCGTYPCGADSALQCVEPCAIRPDSVQCAPGSEQTLSTLRLGAPVEEN